MIFGFSEYFGSFEALQSCQYFGYVFGSIGTGQEVGGGEKEVKGWGEEARLQIRYISDCLTGPCRRGGRTWSLPKVIKEEEEKEVEGESNDDEEIGMALWWRRS